jgi:hypothetical protein
MDLGELDQDSLQMLYNSMKNSIIDVASMDASGIAEMKRFVYDHGKTGDVLRVNVSLDEGPEPKKFLTEAVFIEEGCVLPTLDRNVFLPFERSDTDSGQVTISSSTFEFSSNRVKVDGTFVDFGSPFMVGGRRVVLARGSVVVLVEDTVVRIFPEEDVAEEIVEIDGTLAVGEVNATGLYQVEKKNVTPSSDDPEPKTYIESYVFHHHPSTDQRTCVFKKTHSVDFLQSRGSTLLELGYLNGTLENVLDYESSYVGIRSVEEGGQESVATISIEGLSFNSNESSVSFGALAEFRLKYEETSDTLQIQHRDESSGEYVTKREFGR